MKVGLGAFMLILGFYFFLPAISIGVVFGGLLLGAGALTLKSGVTGRPMLGGSSTKQIGGGW